MNNPLLLDHIAVQRLDRNGRWYVLPVDQIAYMFLGSPSALASIHAEWRGQTRLANGNIYLRTSRGLTTRADFRQFSEIEVRLDQRLFITVNRAVMVNLRRIVELDLEGKIKQIGVAVGDETEWLSISRRPLEPLLDRLGFRKRRPAPLVDSSAVLEERRKRRQRDKTWPNTYRFTHAGN